MLKAIHPIDGEVFQSEPTWWTTDRFLPAFSSAALQQQMLMNVNGNDSISQTSDGSVNNYSRLYQHRVLTLLLAVAVVAVAPLAPTPTSAVPWPPAPNMAPGPNSVPGSPFWGGGGGGNAEKGGATNPSCPPVESWEPCSSGEGRKGEERAEYVISKPLTKGCSFLMKVEWRG